MALKFITTMHTPSCNNVEINCVIAFSSRFPSIHFDTVHFRLHLSMKWPRWLQGCIQVANRLTDLSFLFFSWPGSQRWMEAIIDDLMAWIWVELETFLDRRTSSFGPQTEPEQTVTAGVNFKRHILPGWFPSQVYKHHDVVHREKVVQNKLWFLLFSILKSFNLRFCDAGCETYIWVIFQPWNTGPNSTEHRTHARESHFKADKQYHPAWKKRVAGRTVALA